MRSELRLKDLGKFKTGLTYSPDNLCEPNEGILVLRSANIQNDKIDLNDCVYVNNKIESNMYVRKGDILVCSRNGSANLVGKTAIIEKDMNATWGAFMMLLKTQYNSKYINYILNAAIRKEKGRFATSTINQLTNSMLGGIHVDIFTEEVEQQRIVDYLDEKLAKIDERIEVLEKQQDAYARLKKSVIHQAVTRGLDPDVRLKDSGIEWIGKIPEHWERRRLKDFSVLNPQYVGKDKQTEVSFLPMEGLRYDSTTLQSIPFEEGKGKYTFFADGDLLMAKVTPCFENGNIAIARDLKEGIGFGSSEIFVLRLDRSVSSRFFFYYVLAPSFQDEACSTMCGVGGLKRISPIFMRTRIVFLPPLSEQQAIANYLDEKCAKIDAAIENIGKQIDASKRLKRALINEVITGQRAV
jgi:type I restriction enzyme S subunit